MKRAAALNAMRAAGTQGDQASFLRLYTEHKIKWSDAKREFDIGRRVASSFAHRADV